MFGLETTLNIVYRMELLYYPTLGLQGSTENPIRYNGTAKRTPQGY